MEARVVDTFIVKFKTMSGRHSGPGRHSDHPPVCQRICLGCTATNIYATYGKTKNKKKIPSRRSNGEHVSEFQTSVGGDALKFQTSVRIIFASVHLHKPFLFFYNFAAKMASGIPIITHINNTLTLIADSQTTGS